MEPPKPPPQGTMGPPPPGPLKLKIINNPPPAKRRRIAVPRQRKRNDTKQQAMPGLTVDTTPSSQTLHSPAPPSVLPSTSRSQSASEPSSPPVSPLTPPLPAQDAVPRQIYTHSQPAQTAVAMPAPEPISLDENTDAIALRSAIAILQIQARKAEGDIKTLARIRQKALADPQAYAEAVKAGEIVSEGGDLFNPLPLEDEDEEDDEDDDDVKMEGVEDTGAKVDAPKDEKWEKLPKPQQVVRMPPINWEKYGVMGESLDKLHADQKKRPNEGKPQVIGRDGKLGYGGDAARREYQGVAAPYTPGKDKINKNNKNNKKKR